VQITKYYDFSLSCILALAAGEVNRKWKIFRQITENKWKKS